MSKLVLVVKVLFWVWCLKLYFSNSISENNAPGFRFLLLWNFFLKVFVFKTWWNKCINVSENRVMPIKTPSLILLKRFKGYNKQLSCINTSSFPCLLLLRPRELLGLRHKYNWNTCVHQLSGEILSFLRVFTVLRYRFNTPYYEWKRKLVQL